MRNLAWLLLLAACATVDAHASEPTPPSAAGSEQASSPSVATEPAVPNIAYHQHLFSARTSELIKLPVYDATALLADLDRAGIQRAVVLSMAYTYADERKNVPDRDANVRGENDWTAAEAARSNGRLIGFCSVNPLREAALAEVERCTRLPNIRGLKLHFANSGVNLRNADHASKLAQVFAAANSAGAPIIVHMRLRTSSTDAYGAEDAQLFIDKLLPAAPNVAVQIAHLAGAGSFPEDAEMAMNVFAEAISRDDSRTRNVYFDVTTVAMSGTTKADGDYIAKAIRSVGVERVLFGSDAPFEGNPPPGEAWSLFTNKVPLSEAEFRTIANNVAPYARNNSRNAR